MKQFVASFLKDESGATAIEYGLLCALIAVALIGAISALKPQIEALYASAAAGIPVD